MNKRDIEDCAIRAPEFHRWPVFFCVKSVACADNPEGVAFPFVFVSGTQELASNMNNYFFYILCSICTDMELLYF
jgi:hypothetical protein